MNSLENVGEEITYVVETFSMNSGILIFLAGAVLLPRTQNFTKCVERKIIDAVLKKQ